MLILNSNENIESNVNTDINPEIQNKQMNKLNGKIYELKKDCYKFVHFYLTYTKIVNDFYKFNPKSVNILQFLKVCLHPLYVFCKQVLEIVNRGFTIEPKFDIGLFDTETKKSGICTTSSINLLDIDQFKTRARRAKGGKGYVLKSGIKLSSTKLAEQVISNFNNLFTSLHNIFDDIDAIREKFITSKGFYTSDSEVKISHIYEDFHKYVNNPFKYLDFLISPENYNTETKESLDEKMYPKKSSIKTKRKISDNRKLRMEQMTELFGKVVTFDKFKREKYRKILAKLLTDMAETPKSDPRLTLPSKKRSIQITDDYDSFGENFAKLYKLLLKNLENLVSNKSLLILAVIKEKDVYEKIKAKLNDEAFDAAKELIEGENPKESSVNKRNLIPNYIAKLFINECIAVIETLPCLTEEECGYNADELPDESVIQNSIKPASAKPVSEKPTSITQKTSVEEERSVNELNSNGNNLEEVSFKSGKVETPLKSITPKEVKVEIKEKPKTLRRKKPVPLPRRKTQRVRPKVKHANSPKSSVKKSSVKKSSVKITTPEFIKSVRRKLKTVKRKTGSAKSANPDLLEFLKVREGLRKTSTKLFSEKNNTQKLILTERPSYTSTFAGSKSKSKKSKKSK